MSAIPQLLAQLMGQMPPPNPFGGMFRDDPFAGQAPPLPPAAPGISENVPGAMALINSAVLPPMPPGPPMPPVQPPPMPVEERLLPLPPEPVGQLPPSDPQVGLPPRIDKNYINWPAMQQAIDQMPVEELESLLQALGGERPPLPQPDPGMEEQLRIAQMNRAAMQTQQGAGGMRAGGMPVMPPGVSPQQAPLPQLGPFVPPPIPSGPTAGELLYQAQPMRTKTFAEGVEEAAGVPLTRRMAETLRQAPWSEELATTPGSLAAEHGAPGSSFADWTRAMMSRREDAMAGQLPNVVGPWVGQVTDRRPSTFSQLSDKEKKDMRDRATARREKVELARAARREDLTPSQFKAVQGMRDDPALVREMAAPGFMAAQAAADQAAADIDPQFRVFNALATTVAQWPDGVPVPARLLDSLDAARKAYLGPPIPAGGGGTRNIGPGELEELKQANATREKFIEAYLAAGGSPVGLGLLATRLGYPQTKDNRDWLDKGAAAGRALLGPGGL